MPPAQHDATAGAGSLSHELTPDAVADTAARCPSCGGSGTVIYSLAPDEPDRPYDPVRDGDVDPELLGRGDGSEGGYRLLPYQQFKWDAVAGLGPQWKLSSQQILDWLSAQGITSSRVGLRGYTGCGFTPSAFW